MEVRPSNKKTKSQIKVQEFKNQKGRKTSPALRAGQESNLEEDETVISIPRTAKPMRTTIPT